MKASWISWEMKLKTDCIVYFSANSTLPSFRRKKPNSFQCCPLAWENPEDLLLSDSLPVSTAPSHYWIHQHNALACLPCTAWSPHPGLGCMNPLPFQRRCGFQKLLYVLELAEGGNHITNCMFINLLEQKSASSVGYFIHYNLSR